jgi:hypothetical protein
VPAPKPQNAFTEPSKEAERRSMLYISLVRAQRRYAEKISTPTGPDSRFTEEEWLSLGDNLNIEDLDAAFLENDAQEAKTQAAQAVKKENFRLIWKGREKLAVTEREEQAQAAPLKEAANLNSAFAL